MFFNILKKKKEDNNVSLEKQIERLEQIGIEINSQAPMNELLKIMSRVEIERNPYLYLLIAMGCEYEAEENTWINFSNDIWYLDTECIEDNGDYIRIIERLFFMSKGALSVENVKDNIDFDQRVAYVSFDLLRKNYTLNFEVDDDWLDSDIFNKLNNILNELKIEKRFYVHDVDKGVLVGFFNKSQVFELNKLSVNKLEFF